MKWVSIWLKLLEMDRHWLIILETDGTLAEYTKARLGVYTR